MKIFAKEKFVNRVVLIEVDKIFSNPAQPRRIFDKEDLKNLADSVRENGILQPITVRINSDKKYELVSGERRLKAVKMLGEKQIPCIILKTTDEQSAILALIENLQRKDLNFFEESLAIEKLIQKYNLKQEEVALKLGKAQSTIANKLRILRFTDFQKTKMLKSKLTERHARALLKLPDDESINSMIDYIALKKLNVRDTEKHIDKLLQKSSKKKPKIIPVIKDIRVFLNTIDSAINTMKKAGVRAKINREDSDEYIQYIVRIPNKTVSSVN